MHLPSLVIVSYFVAAAFPTPLLAMDHSSAKRVAAPVCDAPYTPPKSRDVSLRGFDQWREGEPSGGNTTVSAVRFGNHPGRTRVVIDLNDATDFSYKTDTSGTMIMINLPRVDWRAPSTSRRGTGPILGYYFDKEENGDGRFGIATSVPVAVKSAFTLPPEGSRGFRIVLDLVPTQGAKKDTLVSPDKATLVRQDKTRLPHRLVAARAKIPYLQSKPGDTVSPNGGIDMLGTLTVQDKAIKPQMILPPSPPYDARKAPAAPAPMAMKVSKVEASPLKELPGQPVIKCLPFPYIQWWENNTHEEAIKYVNTRYYGNWQAYISKWENHLSKVIDVFAERKKALIEKAGVTLAGEDFINYVHKTEERISIIRCLARHERTTRTSLSLMR